MQDFDIQIETQPTGIVMALIGHANNAHAHALHLALHQTLQSRPHLTILDLRKLKFIASLSLGELINFRREVQTYGGSLRLAGASPAVSDVFLKTRLAEIFPMYESPSQALDD